MHGRRENLAGVASAVEAIHSLSGDRDWREAVGAAPRRMSAFWNGSVAAQRQTWVEFGGCTVNLVEADYAAEFAAELGRRYVTRTGIQPQIHICHASDGARKL